MEAEILDSLDTTKPMTTRKLMTACGVRDTKTIGSISDAAFDFIQLLDQLRTAGHIRLVETRGWIRQEVTQWQKQT